MPSAAAKYAGKDFYKILKVEFTASTQEIKQSYYQLAHSLHPDKHDGCRNKLAQFRTVNEAYNVLRDESKRKEYDFLVGHRYNKNRRAPPPKDYRKVYTSRPPPDWKFVWDHAKHYEMHYGDGFQKEAVRQMRRSLDREGKLEYKSPLGKGFNFTNEPLPGMNGSSRHHQHHNPYSKHAPQGPPKVVFEYSEGSLNGSTGKEHVTRRERIVEDLHTARQERQRQRQQEQNERSAASSPRPNSPFANFSTRANTASRHSRSPEAEGCVIL